MRDSQLNEGFRLKDWEVLPMEGELRSPDGVQRVEPKVMRLLVCLAERAGQAVARDTLIEEVWDGRVISDEALFRCVADLRKRLGDSSSAPEYVQTVHKIGYRLIVPVGPGRPPTAASDKPGRTDDSPVEGWPWPRELDGLEIIRLLGSGSMASVFLARERSLERLVAVKTFRTDSNRVDENASKRLVREAKAAARLLHPHVTAIYRIGELPDGAPYIVQQYVDGPNLAEVIDVEGAMAPDRATVMLRDIADALAAAHDKRIIHRDVKPANILIDSHTGDAYLSDFGLAGMQETGRDDATRLTLAGELLGDPRFISPEQVRGEPVTPVCDVYSFGIVAFMVLGGQYPYNEDDDVDPVMLHIRGAARDLGEVRPEIDESLARIIARCLDKEPRRRPTAEQLVRLLDDDPPEATGDAATIPATRLIGGIALVAVVVAVIWFLSN